MKNVEMLVSAALEAVDEANLLVDRRKALLMAGVAKQQRAQDRLAKMRFVRKLIRDGRVNDTVYGRRKAVQIYMGRCERSVDQESALTQPAALFGQPNPERFGWPPALTGACGEVDARKALASELISRADTV